MTGFYMITAPVMKELIEIKLVDEVFNSITQWDIWS